MASSDAIAIPSSPNQQAAIDGEWVIENGTALATDVPIIAPLASHDEGLLLRMSGGYGASSVPTSDVSEKHKQTQGEEGTTEGSNQDKQPEQEQKTQVPPSLRTEVALERSAVGSDATMLSAVLSVVAPTDAGARAPLRLVAVLDKSGSMQGEKLRLMICTMRFMLRHLSEQDKLGLIEYDTEVKVLAPLTLCCADGRARLDAALARVRSGSQTNLSGGLLRGLDLHRQSDDFSTTSSGSANVLQTFLFGNKYRRLSEDEAQGREHFGVRAAPEGAQRVHEWTMEFRFDNPEDAALVKKVMYKLHDSFAQSVVEIVEGPSFKLERCGWGKFVVRADMHLHDGRVIQVQHDLNFEQPETFHTLLRPLRLAQNASVTSPSAASCSAESGVTHIVGEVDSKASAAVRSTFLFTDGQANIGITKPEGLCAATQSALGELADQRCSLSTFGFGKDHNAELLESLAKEGSGSYSYVESEDQIGQAFGEALGGLLSTTHQNVRLCVELEPGVCLKRACTDFSVDQHHGNDGKAIVNVDIGDMYAEERRDILVELGFGVVGEASDAYQAMPALALGKMHARAFSVLATRSEETATVEFAVERHADAGAAGGSHPQVERHRCRFLATEALKAARVTAVRNLEKARRLLQDAADALGTSTLAKEGDAVVLGLLADVEECLGDLRNQETYQDYGSKKMSCMSRAHCQQRSSNTPSSEMYANHSQLSSKMAFREACR